MGELNEQLVRRITEQVLAALGSGGVGPASGGAADPPGAPARLRPPIGVCTGDYSQFTDRPDLVRPSTPPASTDAAPAEEAKPPRPAGAGVPAGPPPLTGFVTARQVDAVAGRVVRLAGGAKLTPLAVDRVKERGMTVQRGSRNGAAAAPNGGRWLWWIDGRCPAVAKLTGEMADRLAPIDAPGRPLHRMVADAARRVNDGHADGAVLFVASGGRAACFANRCGALRAVVATCDDAVQQGVDLLGANVLVVEYPYHGYEAMRSMVDRFTSADRPATAEVDRALKELSACA